MISVPDPMPGEAHLSIRGDDCGVTDVRRNALNQALFREVNQRIRGMAADEREGAQLAIICECGDTGCTQAVTVTLGDYETLRADPVRFILAPGHHNPMVESVVDERVQYTVVRNEGRAARIARETIDSTRRPDHPDEPGAPP